MRMLVLQGRKMQLFIDANVLGATGVQPSGKSLLGNEKYIKL